VSKQYRTYINFVLVILSPVNRSLELQYILNTGQRKPIERETQTHSAHNCKAIEEFHGS